MAHQLKLVLIYTLKCNALCNSCCFECSPLRPEKMELSNALRVIDESVISEQFNSVSITGGEALLYEDEVIEIIKYSFGKGLKTSLTTNGFWGTSVKDSLEKLTNFKKIGLTSLNLSSDEFHSKYIPYEFIENILIANETVKIVLNINDVRIKSSIDHPLLGKYKTNSWISGSCVPVGRAKTFICDHEFITGSCKGRCTMTDTLHVKPDGITFPCCSIGGDSSVLNLGNIFESSLSNILLRKESLPFLNVVNWKGPKWLKEIGIENNIFLNNSREEYVNMCHMCNEMGDDEEFLTKMEPLINEMMLKINYNKYFKL